MTKAELDAIVDAARARQADITPAPWVLVSKQHDDAMEGGNTDVLDTDGYSIGVEDTPDGELITAAPLLNAVVIALDDQIKGKDTIIAQLLKHNETLQQIARSYTTGGRIAGVEKMIEGDND